MKKRIMPRPPSGAPEATVWFGGPVDRWKVALRIYGEELDPDRISILLGCAPSSQARKGNPFPRKGRWILEIVSDACDEDEDLDGGIKMLLAKLPSDTSVWLSLTSMYAVDVFCAVSLKSTNRGFAISAEVSRLLSDRNLEIGFDIYCESSDPPAE
jgi:hypothetical protein